MDPEVREPSFHEYLYVLLTRKWIIISIFAVTFLSAVIYLIFTPRLYESSATLMVEPPKAAGATPIYPGSYFVITNVRNYCEILRSETVARHAVERLLSERKEYSFLSGKFPADNLLRRISIKPIIDTDIIKIQGRGETPKEAIDIVNAVIDGFIEEQLLVARKEFSEQRKFIEEQIPEVEKDLISCEKEIKDFKERNRVVELSSIGKEMVGKLAELDILYAESEANYKALDSRLSTLKDQLAERKSSLLEDITRVSSPYILQLRKELLSLETNLSLYMIQGLTDEDPKILDLMSSIEKTKEQLVSETRKIVNKNNSSRDPLSVSEELVENILKLEIELSGEEIKRTSIGEALKKYENYLYSLPAKEFKLAQLERRKTLNSTTYNTLMSNYETTKLAEAGRSSDIRIVDRANIPKVPVKPKRSLILALSIFLGLVLGVGGAFMVEYIGTTVKTSKDVKIYFDLPVIGNIPKSRAVKLANGNKNGLLTHYPINSPIYEAYRALRTNLSFVSPDMPLRTILVTSSLPGEGKTTVTSNLGIVMAQLEKKVLLIDADLRKMALTNYFEIKSEIGLTDVLLDEKLLRGAIVNTDLENLSILPGGRVPPNPSELLASKRMMSLIESLKDSYNCIIIDSPPILSVTDSSILASKLDSTLLVIQANKTNRLAILRAKETLEHTNARLISVILNMIPLNFPMYGYPYYYSYSQSSQEHNHKGDKGHRSGKKPNEV